MKQRRSILLFLAALLAFPLFADAQGLLRSRGAPAAWCWRASAAPEPVPAGDEEPAPAAEEDEEEAGSALGALPENCDAGGAVAVGSYKSRLFPGRVWSLNLLGGVRTVGVGAALSPARAGPAEGAEGEEPAAPPRWLVGLAFVTPWGELGSPEMELRPALFVVVHF